MSGYISRTEDTNGAHLINITHMKTSSRISVTKTELPPCCLRIHPRDNSLIFLGSYKLEDNGTRHGSLDVMKHENGTWKVLSRHATASAILDVKFDPFDDTILVTGHSTGNIAVWKVEDSFELNKIEDRTLFDPEVLVTSVFFSPSQKGMLFATLTSGESALVDLKTFQYETLNTSHELECWTGSFGESGALSQVVYSGGDDCKLIAHDIRTKESIWTTTRRQHEAGVVSILSSGPDWNTGSPHQLWSGSYDDNLRVFDLRLMDKQNPSLIPGYIPKVLSQENLGGGVWRLIPSPKSNDSRVLACCMYDGARIIEPKDDSFKVSRYFKGDHESMCYGGDWGTSGDLLVTCSFYDNVVQAWSPDETD